LDNTLIKICYFPGRESTYARTKVLLKAMRVVGIEVMDCSTSRKSRFRYLIGFLKFLKYKSRSDIVFIGFFGHFLIPLVKLLTRKKILFDSFVSIHLTMVVDRKEIKPNTFLESLTNYFDWLACRLADSVFAGTNQEIEYLTRKGNLNKNKFHRLFVGADDSFLYPQTNPNDAEFIVHFHGEFQTLHGTPYIVEAARLLPDIKFQMIGKGRDWNHCLQKAAQENIKNIQFIPPVPYKELPKYIAKAHVCLGLFGDTVKTQTVIPHKVYEAMAMGKPIITADTPAIKELLTHLKDVYLCQAADPSSLADAIKTLKENAALRKKIAENAYQTFLRYCSPEVLGKEILKQAKELINTA